MKKFLIKILPLKVIRLLLNIRKLNDFNFVASYSQEGEDMVLRAIFHGKQNGFYIDIGAHHPKIFSNTFYFYEKGWRGINIDAMPGSMNIFNNIRKKDINLEIAISDISEVLTYFAFNEPALNTFSKELAEERIKIPKFKLLFKKEILTERLGEVLKKYLPNDQSIDFMSVDVEGLDLNVLKSNDWDLFRPKVILIESLEFSIKNIDHNPIATYLHSRGYNLFSKTVNTLIFAERNFKVNIY